MYIYTHIHTHIHGHHTPDLHTCTHEHSRYSSIKYFQTLQNTFLAVKHIHSRLNTPERVHSRLNTPERVHGRLNTPERVHSRLNTPERVHSRLNTTERARIPTLPSHC